MGDDPAYLPVGTAVSAKYKGAFCEAKVSKVVRVVKCKITYKGGLGTSTLTDEHIRGPLRIGHTVQARHPDKKEYIEATITKIQDCSQYTVVFDDGDITTLRRTALCLKSGRHFNESETLDQLPLTHPEHWGFPVGGGRGGRGRRSRGAGNLDDNDDMSIMGDDAMSPSDRDRPDPLTEMYSSDIGKVVCVEAGDKKKRDNWFPGLVVVPSAQPTVRINVREEYLIRSFKDGRYYTVPRKEILEFSRDMGRGVENTNLQEAMERALKYLDRDELPAHWERGPLFDLQPAESDSDAVASDSSDDEPREEKDHFVAQLYKFMDDRGTPLNKNPTIAGRDVDLYRLFRVVHKLGGCNRVTNQNKWRSVAVRLGYAHNQATINSVRQAYKKFLLNFEDFYRKLGCTMINHPRTSSISQSLSAAKKNRGRSLIRDRDRATPSSPRPRGENSENEKRDTDSQSDAPEPPDTSNSSSDLDSLAQTPRASKSRPKSQPAPAKRPGGDKVKALVDKFEEHARASSTSNVEEEKPSQRPRSKSVGPQRSSQASTSGRATPAPRHTKTSEPESKTDNKATEAKKQKVEKKSVEESESKQTTVRGRKKKDDKSSETSSTQNSSTDVSEETGPSSQVSANVGDKLKVYYGPTHESKVTYEAKVLDIDRDHKDGCVMYLVHYTGWNMRYDEWIRPQRIAENLSAMNKAARQQTKSTKTSSASPKTTVKKGGKTTSTSTASTSSNTKEPRSNTPQQNTRSPSRRAAQNSRRTRRTSVVSTITSDTDNDENDDTKSDSEPEILPQSNRTRSSTRMDTESDKTDKGSDKIGDKKRKVSQRRIAKDKTGEKTDDNDKTDDEKPPKRAKRLVKKPPIVEKTTDESDEDSSPPKGRDFDLNQIRSELKGFEKAVKVAVTNVDTPENTDEKTGEKSASDSEKPAEKSSPSTDDIYEFKEPEPFEFESRKLTPVDQEKGKKRIVKRDDSPQPNVEKSPPQTPKKKGTKSPQTTTTEETKKRTTPNTYRRSTARKTPTISEEEKDSTEKKSTDENDLFDKLAESPSYNVSSALGKESAKNSPKPVKLNLDSDSDIPPLFRDLPATSSVEITTSIEDSGSASEDLGPEPPPFDQQPSVSTLDHIFKGFTESVKPLTEVPTLPSNNPSIEKTPANTLNATSDDDDPIGAAIHRVMSHTMTDESSSGDELFIRATKKIETTKTEPTIQTQSASASSSSTTTGTTVKQISPALQETDSRLLEAISQQTQNLFKKEEKIIKNESEIKRESPTPKVTTKIADTLLQKLSMIKKIEDTDSNDSNKDDLLEKKPRVDSPKSEIKTEPVSIEEKKSKTTPKVDATVTLKQKPETKLIEAPKEKTKPILEEKRPKISPETQKLENPIPEPDPKTTEEIAKIQKGPSIDPKVVKPDPKSKIDPKIPQKVDSKVSKIDPKIPKVDPKPKTEAILQKNVPNVTKTEENLLIGEKSTRVDPKVPKIDPKVSKVDPKTPKIDPKIPKVDPKTQKVDPKTPKVDPKIPKVDPKTTKVDPKTTKVDPKTPKLDPKTPKVDTKAPKVDTKTPKVDPKTPKVDPKTPKVDSKTPKVDPKTLKVDPKVSKVDPKTPKVDPKPTKVDLSTKVQKSDVVKSPKSDMSRSPRSDTKSPKFDIQKPTKVDSKVPKVDPKCLKTDVKMSPKSQVELESINQNIDEFLTSPKHELKTEVSEISLASTISEDILPKKRPLRKQVVSREYIEDSDSDSSTSTDPTTSSETDESSSDGLNQNRPKRARLGRLVIAQDDDSQDQDQEMEQKSIETEVILENIVPQTSEVKDEEPSSDISLLLCKETIPGSPASSEPGVSNKIQNVQSSNSENIRNTPKPRSAKSLMLEMPFASAPSNNTNIQSTIQSHQNIESQENTEKIVRSPPPLIERNKNTGPISPHMVSNQNQTVKQTVTQQSEMEILDTRRVSVSREDDDEDTPISHEPKKSSHDQSSTVHTVGRKRRRSHRATDDITSGSNQPSTSNVAPPPAKRGRKPLNRNLNITDPNSDDDQPISAGSSTNLSNTQAHRTPPRTSSHVHPRYNFLVELDPSMDSPARIALLQQKLQELRKCYNDVKNELAIIDRRRKKLRRRERDQLKQHKQEMMQAVA